MAVQDTVPPTTASGVFVVAVWLATHLLIFVPAYAQTEKFFYISCGTIALVVYSPKPAPTMVSRRLGWVPSWLLRAASKYRRVAWCGLLTTVATITLALVDGTHRCGQPLRVAFAFFYSVIHFDLYSTLGNHQGFMLLFTAAVLALPPSEYRQIALQAAAAHQLGSSGLQKLKIGGLRWPKSLALSLQYHVSNGPTIASDAYLEPDFVKLKSVVRALLAAPPTVLETMGAAALLVEVLSIPLILLPSTPLPGVFGMHSLKSAFGSTHHLFLFLAGGFHISIALMTGIIFPFNAACYTMAAIAAPPEDETSELGEWCCIMICGFLLATTVFSIENWPFNALALYPFNDLQIKRLEHYFNRFYIRVDKGAVCCAGGAESKEAVKWASIVEAWCPPRSGIFVPGLIRAVLGENFEKTDCSESDEKVKANLEAWLKESTWFVHCTTKEPLDCKIRIGKPAFAKI